jgi:hypothetical protein
MITNTAFGICRLEFFAQFGLYRLKMCLQICLEALIDTIGLRVDAQNRKNFLQKVVPISIWLVMRRRGVAPPRVAADSTRDMRTGQFLIV